MRSILKYFFLLSINVAVVTTPVFAGGDYYGRGQSPTWIATYSGFDVAKDSHYFYSGAVVALNGDLSRSGFVLQGFSGVASYEYDNVAVPGGIVDGDGIQLSAMLGYLFVLPEATVGLYAGVDYQDYDLTPRDPSNSVSGSETGVRVGGDVRLIGPQHYFTLEGYYSTAFDSYWARARAGVKVARFTVGPEGIILGNEGYDAQRLGAFALTKIHLSPSLPTELTFHVGYQFVDEGQTGTTGGEGVYGGLNIGFTF